MTEVTESNGLKGNPRWSFFHALNSLRRNKVLSLGIILLLSLGIALPTSVFIWSETGARMTVERCFNDNIYQFRIHPNERMSEQQIQDTNEKITAWTEIDIADTFPSTICILNFPEEPHLNWYAGSDFHSYATGYKDARVIPITSEKLQLWKSEFDFEGNFTLLQGQVLVSQKFIEYTQMATGKELEIGSAIDLDILSHLAGRGIDYGYIDDLGVETIANLTIAGIYQIKSLLTQLSSAFPSRQRHNGLVPIPDWKDPVLGIDDSVLILESDLSQEAIESITSDGFFFPDILIRGNLEYLLSFGATNAPSVLEQTKTRIDEELAGVLVTGIRELSELRTRVEIYIKSQILTLLVFPVLVMSLMLTVFTSEASINRRKLETQTLRAKGASYSQIVSSFMSESIVLAILGFIGGIILATYLAPLLGAADTITSINQEKYVMHLSHTTYQPMTLIIAAIISFYLPSTYLFQTVRLVENSEIGQPLADELPDEAEEFTLSKYVIAFALVLVALLLMPILILPYNLMAVLQILIATLLLYAGAYYGSRIIRLLTSKGNRLHRRVLGEKALYVVQSFKRRRGHFMPLLVILTLTFSTTTMILIQSSSFDATLKHELQFSIGADARVECDGMPLSFKNNLSSSSFVDSATGILSSSTRFTADEHLIMYGIDSLEYLRVAEFAGDCFVDESPEEALTKLNNSQRGIIISTYHAEMLDKKVGDTISLLTDANSSFIPLAMITFEIVCLMRYSPGFGASAPLLDQGDYLATQIGFQAAQDGFVLVNQQYFISKTDINISELFFVRMKPEVNKTSYLESLDQIDGVKVYSADTFDILQTAPTSALFLAGLRGHLLIEGVACLVMGLASIGLFLGSAVTQRKKEYAIIRALGATSSQIRSVVFGEFAGSVISALLASTIVGITFGFSMTILTFGIAPFVTVVGYNIVIPFDAILIAILLETLVLTIACAAPASLASHVEPMRILRNL